MKKLKYEKPEVEIELLDPELDIIRTSPDIETPDPDPVPMSESSFFIE